MTAPSFPEAIIPTALLQSPSGGRVAGVGGGTAGKTAWWLGCLMVALWSVPVAAQGLNEPGKRLDETLGNSSPPASGAAPAQNSSAQGSRPPGSQPPGSQPPGSQPPGSQNPGSQPPSGYGSDGGYDQSMNMDDMYMEEEMNMGDMYMEGEGGSYGRGGGRSGTPGADAMATYGNPFVSLLSGLKLAPLVSPTADITVVPGPLLAHEAEQTFAAGYPGLATDLMFGHMVTEYSDAVVALNSVKYSALLRRPVWAIRWGISMTVRGEGITDPSPIREGATPNRRMAMQGGGEGGYDASMEQGMDAAMQQEMEMQMQQSMAMEMGMEMDGGYGGGNRRPAPAGPKIPQRDMLSKEADETLDKTIGLVAKVIGEEFSSRFAQGNFGPLMINVAPPVATVAAGAARPANNATAAPAIPSMSVVLNDLISEAPQPLPMWQPGLVYLGQGHLDELLPQAQAENLDLLLHVDVILKTARNEAVQNVCRVRLINVATGKSLGISKSMDNWEAAQMAAAGRMDERAYVQESLSNLWGIVDRQAVVSEMPKLSPEHAKSRIAALIAGPNARSLRTLAEVRMFQLQGLISDAEAEAVFDIIGGPDALMLMHGPYDEKIAMTRKWALESQAHPTE